MAISMIDLTTLEGKDSEGKVDAMCQKAIHPKPGNKYNTACCGCMCLSEYDKISQKRL